jgi:hypothetical protein
VSWQDAAMPAALRDLPFFNHDTVVEVAGQRYQVFARQHVVWVSVGHKALRELHAGTPYFPAIYDSGFTDAFLIHRHQLQQFASLHPQYLPALNRIMRPHGLRIPVRAANVWLHPNRRGYRDEFSGAAPFLLEVHRGIGISDEPDGYPRLPLLGPLAFMPSGLEVCIDHGKLRINARTPRRFWFF